MTRSIIGDFLKNGKDGLHMPQSKYITINKKNDSLCRFDLYTQHFFNGIVKEHFDKCQVWNLRLKSGLKSLLMGVNMILLKMKVDSVRE